MTDKKYAMVLMESTRRGKWIYGNSKSIDDMIKCLGGEIAFLEDLQELGAKLEDDGGCEDDYATLTIEAEEDSEKFKKLGNEYGFMKVEFDEAGERIES